MLNSVDAAVSGLDNLIKCNERCLKRCQLNQQVDSFLIVGLKFLILTHLKLLFIIVNDNLQSLELLSTFSKPSQLVRISTILKRSLKYV